MLKIIGGKKKRIKLEVPDKKVRPTSFSTLWKVGDFGL